MVNKRGENHGFSKTRLYRCWQSMKARCYQKNNWKYDSYNGRGITVCDDWRNDFLAFREWALKNGYQDTLTLDRIDNDGNYEPSNCRWATALEQNNNSRRCRRIEWNEETHNLVEWAEITGLTYGALVNRLFRGWDIERALSTPLPPSENKSRMNGGTYGA